MHSVRKTLSAITLAAVFSTGAAFAQHHDDRHDNNRHDDNHGGGHGYVKHNDWHSGGRISHDDWNRGGQVDWHAHHLQAPRRGYEWREVDGNYVMAAVATGVIASAIIAAGH